MVLRKLPAEVSSLIDSSSHVSSLEHVTKELVYNALDSDASSIAIRIDLQERQIQVVDNGCGVSKSDMEYIGEKNYTSKCNIYDFNSPPTKYGFRGKSLSNIVAVSEMVRIISRLKETADTYSKTFVNGKFFNILKVDLRPSQGTTVEVKGSFYNLTLNNKLYNSIQDIQDIKLFLERVALMHHDVSISLRDDVKNEIILSFRKKRDIFQTIESIFGITKSNLQELHVEKNAYKVIAYIEKNYCSKNKFQLIYLNARFLYNCKLHTIVKDNLLKVLGLKMNNSKTYRDKNIYEDKTVDNMKLPFYIIFFTCPYNKFVLNEFSKQSVVEFLNWDAVCKIFEKLIKFYTGDIKLKEITPPQNGKQKANDTRDQIKDIMDRLFDSKTKTCGVSQMHNVVPGKLVKRKNKKRYVFSPKTVNIKNKIVQDENNPVKDINEILSHEDNVNIEKKTVPIKKDCKYVSKGTTTSKRSTVYNKSDEICVTPKNTKSDLRKVFENPSDSVKKRTKALAERVQKNIFKIKQRKFKQSPRREAKNINIDKKNPKYELCKNSKMYPIRRSTNHYKNDPDKHLVVSSYDLIKTVIGCENITSFSYRYQNVYKNRHCNNEIFKESKNNYDSSFNVLCSFKRHNEYYLKKNNYTSQQISVMDSESYKIISKNPSYDTTHSQKMSITRYKNICKKFKHLNKNAKPKDDMIKSLKSNQNTQESIFNTDESDLILIPTSQKRGRYECNVNCNVNNRNIRNILNDYPEKPACDKNTMKNFKVYVDSIFSGDKIIESEHTSECFNNKSFKMCKVINGNYCCRDTEITQNNLEQNVQFNFTSNLNFEINDHRHNNSNENKFKTSLSGKQREDTIKDIHKEKKYRKLVDDNINTKNFNVVFISSSLPHLLNAHSSDAKICDPKQVCEAVMEFSDFDNETVLQNSSANIHKSNWSKNICSQFFCEELVMHDPQKSDAEKNLRISQNRLGDLGESSKKTALETIDDDTNKLFMVNLSQPENIEKTLLPFKNDNFIPLSSTEEEIDKLTANFNFKSRLNFVPKGMSPIFENYSNNFMEISLDVSCFNKSYYTHFLNKIEKDSKIYENIIQDRYIYSTGNFNRVHTKIMKDKSAIVFDASCLKSAKVLNQVDGKFISAKIHGRNIVTNIYNEHLALFDQHAVHERIQLEKNMSAYIQNDCWRSAAVDVILLNLSREEILYLHNYREKFLKYGLEWVFVDESYISVLAIPQAILGKRHRETEVLIKAIKSLIAEVVYEMKTKKGSPSMYPKSIMDLVFSEACKSAMKFGDVIPQNKCAELIRDLSICKTPFQCAHGRPTLAVLLELHDDNQDYKINLDKVKKYFKAR